MHAIVEPSITSPDNQADICEVCQDLSDGLHFSVHTCRACAAFFRRTISLNLKYICRRDKRCPIQKSDRNMCKPCRFVKCLDSGMQIGAVQMPRDSNRKRKDLEKQSAIDRNVMDPTRAQNSEPTAPFTSKETYMEHYEGSRAEKVYTTSRNRDHMRIIPKVLEGYNQFLSIRKAHIRISNESSSQTNKLALRPAHFDSSRKMCKEEAHLFPEIVNKHFHPFRELHFTDKVLMFKNFFCYFFQADRAFQSFNTFNGYPNDDRLLMPDGGYLKLSDLESFYANSESVKASPEEAAKIFLPAMQYILEVIVEHMRRIGLTVTEYMCILGLFLWNEGVHGITPETLTIVHNAQADILSDLHIYYRSLGLDGAQITAKTALLMMLMPKLARSVVMMRENFELAELFDVFADDFCTKKFKNASVD